MSNSSKPFLRIDWFDGTVVEDTRPAIFEAEEDTSQQDIELASQNKPRYTERKLMGFKRLLDISQQETTSILLQLSERSSFWDLLDSELKNDYIVLVTKIICKLYTFLLSGQKSIMLTKLLNTKFIPSNFLKTLSEYMLNLPSTRIVEKRLNMMFWNDVESFCMNVLGICEGICTLHLSEVEKIGCLLGTLQTTVDGLIEEHSERFSETLFCKIADITQMYQRVCDKVSL